MRSPALTLCLLLFGCTPENAPSPDDDQEQCPALAVLDCKGIDQNELCAACHRGFCALIAGSDGDSECRPAVDPLPGCEALAAALPPETEAGAGPFATGALLLHGEPLPTCEGGFLWTWFVRALASAQPLFGEVVIDGAVFSSSAFVAGPRQERVVTLDLFADVCLRRDGTADGEIAGMQFIDVDGNRGFRSCGSLLLRPPPGGDD